MGSDAYRGTDFTVVPDVHYPGLGADSSMEFSVSGTPLVERRFKSLFHDTFMVTTSSTPV
jgi:hypothetical protein